MAACGGERGGGRACGRENVRGGLKVAKSNAACLWRGAGPAKATRIITGKAGNCERHVERRQKGRREEEAHWESGRQDYGSIDEGRGERKRGRSKGSVRSEGEGGQGSR